MYYRVKLHQSDDDGHALRVPIVDAVGDELMVGGLE